MSTVIERETVNLAEAARSLGIGRNSAYEAVRRGDFPVEVIRIGKRILVPTASLRRALGQEVGGAA